MNRLPGRSPDDAVGVADGARFNADQAAELFAGYGRGRDPVIPFPVTTRRHEGPSPSEDPRVIVRRGSDVEPTAVSWLWHGWLAVGKLNLIAGAPGTGKTTLALTMAAAVTTGGSAPDGSPVQAGEVMVWSGEDDDDDTLNPRLRAAGADMDRVWVVSSIEDRGQRYPFDPARDLPLLKAALLARPGVRLLMVDPVVSAVAGDSHKNAEVRRALQPLVELAKDHNCAVLGITHLTKGTSGRDPIERVTGSLAFGALPRVVMLTARREASAGRTGCRMLLRAKATHGEDGGGFEYRVEAEPLPGYPHIEASRVVWGGPLVGSARELLSDADAAPGADREDLDAVSVLRAILASGPRPVGEVFQEAEAAGFSRPAMHRAKRKLGVVVAKGGMRCGWIWTMRDRHAEGGEDHAMRRPSPSSPSMPSSG